MLLPDAAIERFGFTDYALPPAGHSLCRLVAPARVAARRRATTGAASLDVRLRRRGRDRGLQLEGEPAGQGRLLPRRDGRRGVAGQRSSAWGARAGATSFAADRVIVRALRARLARAYLLRVRAHASGLGGAGPRARSTLHVSQAYCSDQPSSAPSDLAAAAGHPELQGVVVRERHPGAPASPGKRTAWRWGGGLRVRSAAFSRPARGAGGPGASAAAVSGARPTSASSATNTTRTFARPSNVCATSRAHTTG